MKRLKDLKKNKIESNILSEKIVDNNNNISINNNENEKIESTQSDTQNNFSVIDLSNVTFDNTPTEPKPDLEQQQQSQETVKTQVNKFTANTIISIIDNLQSSVCYLIHKKDDKIKDFKFTESEKEELINLFEQAYPELSINPKTLFYFTLLVIISTNVFNAYKLRKKDATS